MVNLRAAERQALGKHFIPGADEDRRVEELRQRRLTMAPHKPWTLPEQPTWTENPFSDNNWQFQYHMLRWLDPLRRAGQAGDTAAAEQWAHYARSWIQTNPPGASESSWAWVDMADGIRAMELCHGLCAVGEQDWLVRSLEQHRDWLIDPAHIKHGNHGLHQTVGLFVVSAVLEDSAGMDTAVSRLGERLLQSWDQQGVNEEGSLAYHRMNYVWWQETLVRLDLEGVSRPEGAERLTLAPEEMAHATSPLGKLARIGDTNDASISDIDDPFAKYVTSGGRRGAAPAQNVAIYDSGYAYVRSGWGQERPFSEETFLTAMFGPQDKVHGHRDGGSITYCTKGVQWLHDQGRFYYGKDPMQRYVVSRGAHSLVVLPGRTARASAVVELVHQDITDDYVDLLISDPSYEGVEITRRIVYLKHWDLTVVLDQVRSDESVVAEQRWHCGRGVEAKALSLGFSLSSQDKTFHVANLTSQTKRDVRSGEKTPMIGWTATGWRKSAPVDVGTVYDEGPDLRFGALLGTWTPAAVDLMSQALAQNMEISGELSSLIPTALLHHPWNGAFSVPARRRPQALEAQVQLVGDRILSAVADGPGRHFKFDVVDDGGTIYAGSWRGERSFTLQLERTAGVRLVVSHKIGSGESKDQETHLEHAIDSIPETNGNYYTSNDDPISVLLGPGEGNLTTEAPDGDRTDGHRRLIHLHSEKGHRVVEVRDRLDGSEKGGIARFSVPPGAQCLLRGTGAEIFREGHKVFELTWRSPTPVVASTRESDTVEYLILTPTGQSAGVEVTTMIRDDDFFYRDWGVRPDSPQWQQHPDEVPVNYLLDEVPGASDLAVVFSALGPKGSFTYNYKNTLDDLPVHKMYVLDDFGDQGAYFYSEAKDLRIYRSVLRAIQAATRSLGVSPRRVHMLGTSKGGSAALIFGAALDSGSILVGAPQIRIGYFLHKPHPNILRFMTGAEDQSAIDWADQIIPNHLRRLSFATHIEALIGDQDHHYRHHHPVLKRLLQGSENDRFRESVLPGVNHQGIGVKYRSWLPDRLLARLEQRRVLELTLGGWHLTGFARGRDLLMRISGPRDGSAAALYVYQRGEILHKFPYASGERWLRVAMPEGIRIRLFVRQGEEVEAKSSPTINGASTGSSRDSALIEVVRNLVPAHNGGASQQRGLKLWREGLITHPVLGEIPLDNSMRWPGVSGRTNARFLHGFLFLADWHESVLPHEPAAVGLAAELFRKWAEANPAPRNPAGQGSESMAYHDETTAQRGMHLARFVLENWDRLNESERRNMTHIMRAMTRILSEDWFHGGVNNHGMFQDCALLLLGVVGRDIGVMSEAEVQAPMELGASRLVKYFTSSFSRDGVHLENSPGYHLMAARSLRDVTPLVARVLPSAGDELKRIHVAAERYATHAIMPDGFVPPVSDTKQFSVGKSSHAATFAGEEYRWAASVGERGTEPAERTAIFADAGYAVHRTSWTPKADWLFFTAGYRAQFHHHSDDLSLLFFRDGGLVLGEAGPYGYDYADPRTQYAFSQWAHNTIIVDGKSLPRVDRKPGGVELRELSKTTEGAAGSALSVEGRCARTNKWVHTRNVTSWDTSRSDRMRVIVTDRVVCSGSEMHSFECLWHAGPGVDIEIVGSAAIFSRSGDHILSMRWEAAEPVEATTSTKSDPLRPRSLRFPTFGAQEEGTVLNLKVRGQSLELNTVIE